MSPFLIGFLLGVATTVLLLAVVATAVVLYVIKIANEESKRQLAPYVAPYAEGPAPGREWEEWRREQGEA